MKKQLLLVVGILFFASGTVLAQYKHKTIEAKKFEKRIARSHTQLVDVRTPAEYAEGHIADAVNADVLSNNFDAQLTELNKEKPVYIYCKSGKRSAQAADKLRELGFKKVIELKGGITAWNEFRKE